MVGILQRNWRDYVVTFPPRDSTQSQSRNSQRILAVPWDHRIPKIRISTQQADALQVCFPFAGCCFEFIYSLNSFKNVSPTCITGLKNGDSWRKGGGIFSNTNQNSYIIFVIGETFGFIFYLCCSQHWLCQCAAFQTNLGGHSMSPRHHLAC